MALQNYTPMRLAPTADPILRNELLKVDVFLRQLTAFGARVPTFPQGTTSIDLSQFLFLPGRVPEQRAFGNVVFSGKSTDEANVLDDSVYRGLTIKATDDTGVQRTTHTVYFQPDSVAAANIVRKWIFPSITGSVTDTFTFATTSGNQTITNKIITTSQIYVGTAAARNIFINSNNVNQQFYIGLATTFPLISVLTPQLRLPALNQSEPAADRHTFMMLNASIAAPFTIGSIAHGNHDGSEMEMLPAATTNGLALRWNNGESVAACTWVTGTTTIFGSFNIANTRIGMRIRGGTSASVCVDEFTRITAIADLVSVDVDTPLVGNSASTTCQTWGPTWDNELAGLDHSSLNNLSNFDDHPQYLYLQGRAGGQVLGNSAHTGGLFADLAIEGRLLLGDGLSGVNFTSGRALDIRHALTNNSTYVNLAPLTGAPSGASSGTLTMLNVTPPTAVAYTSGSYSFRGMTFTATGLQSPSGVTVLTTTPLFIQSTPGEGNDPGSGGVFGKINSYRGIDLDVRGSTDAAQRTITVTTNGTTAITSAGLFVAPIASGQFITKSDIPARTTVTITDASNAVLSNAATGSSASTAVFYVIATDMIGLRMGMSGRAKPTSLASFIHFLSGAGGTQYAVAANILEVNATTPFDTTGVVTWSLLKMPTTVVNPGTIWIFNITAVNNSRHAGNFSIGSTATPTAKAHLGAGTTAASSAPLKFTSGTNMTAAEAGAVEFTTDDFFATITTGAARKAFVLDDGARLTATRVPFATTNGRLTDDADLTFVTDTLTSTKLAISQGAIISGIYTPTLTNVANIDASTVYQCQYMRVGNVVTVSGKVDIDPTLAGAQTQLGITLPIASNFGAEEDCGGVAFAKAVGEQGAGIFADAANGRAQLEWFSTNTTNNSMYFTFTYRII